jgi:hypothetical protein
MPVVPRASSPTKIWKTLCEFKRPKGSKALGTILAQTDILRLEVLENEIRRYIVEVIHDLLKWEKGSFHFELGASAKMKSFWNPELNTEFLLLEATRLRMKTVLTDCWKKKPLTC